MRASRLIVCAILAADCVIQAILLAPQAGKARLSAGRGIRARIRSRVFAKHRARAQSQGVRTRLGTISHYGPRALRPRRHHLYGALGSALLPFLNAWMDKCHGASIG
jgi:hypothetical protein